MTLKATEHDKEFKKSMLSAQEVMQCYYVTGDYDYVVIATFNEMGDYEEFTKKYFLKDPNIKRFNSMVVMNKVKENLSIPLNYIINKLFKKFSCPFLFWI